MEANMDPSSIPSLETFRYVWRNSFSHLKIPRYNTLGACDVCETLKQAKKQTKRKTRIRKCCTGTVKTLDNGARRKKVTDNSRSRFSSISSLYLDSYHRLYGRLGINMSLHEAQKMVNSFFFS